MPELYSQFPGFVKRAQAEGYTERQIDEFARQQLMGEEAIRPAPTIPPPAPPPSEAATQLQGFTQQGLAEGYTRSEIDEFARGQIMGPALEERYATRPDRPTEPTGAPLTEALYGAAYQIGGVPEAATTEGMAQSYQHSRDELDASLKEVFGAASEGISYAIAAGSGIRTHNTNSRTNHGGSFSLGGCNSCVGTRTHCHPTYG